MAAQILIVNLASPSNSGALRGFTMTREADLLAHVPIFARLKGEELERLAKHVQHHAYESGEEIISEGESDARLFVIVSGSVEVVKSRGSRNERLLAKFGPSEYFGEMALIDGCVRSATVIGKEETHCLSLEHLNLRKEIERNPSMALELLQMLTLRVRALEKSLMRSLGGLLPICLNCKSVRDEDGSWVRMEEYISDHSDADFTHGICPDCMRKLYPKHFGGPAQ